MSVCEGCSHDTPSAPWQWPAAGGPSWQGHLEEHIQHRKHDWLPAKYRSVALGANARVSSFPWKITGHTRFHVFPHLEKDTAHVRSYRLTFGRDVFDRTKEKRTKVCLTGSHSMCFDNVHILNVWYWQPFFLLKANSHCTDRCRTMQTITGHHSTTRQTVTEHVQSAKTSTTNANRCRHWYNKTQWQTKPWSNKCCLVSVVAVALTGGTLELSNSISPQFICILRVG